MRPTLYGRPNCGRPNLLTALVLSIALVSACASPPTATIDINPTELRPERNERVKIDRAFLVVDASGSIDRRTQFPDAKALVARYGS